MKTTIVNILNISLGFLAFSLLLMGCSTTTYPLIGLLYSGVTGGVAVGPAEKSTQSGEACAHAILGMVAFGDASIEKAKMKGQITKISNVDFDSMNILGVYGHYCTIVRGVGDEEKIETRYKEMSKREEALKSQEKSLEERFERLEKTLIQESDQANLPDEEINATSPSEKDKKKTHKGKKR